MFQLAVCAEMVFRDLPFVERVRAIAGLGFHVEIWDWTKHDIDALVATGAAFSSMTGYVSGDLVTKQGAAALLETAAGDRGREALALPAPESAWYRPGAARIARYAGRGDEWRNVDGGIPHTD